MTLSLERFYPILDSDLLAAADVDPVEAARALAAAGARLVQFRHKAAYTREIYARAKAIGQVVQQAGGRYIINDRVDIALMIGADGVHLGQDDLPPEAARRMAGDRLLIGFSTHNEAQLRAAADEPADYLAIGPIFGTRSKANPDPVVGVEELRRLRAMTEKPLVAIGGITRERAAAVFAAGADSVAVLSDVVATDFYRRAAEWMELTR